MELELARNWWVVALRGVLAILFGGLVFFWPGLLWFVVVCMFAAYALLDGALAIIAAVARYQQGRRWWAFLLEGLVGIAAGVLAIAWPDITELVLFYLIAGWCLASGVFEIAAAIQLRQYIRGEWVLALSGVLSIILGLALALFPLEGLLVIAWWIGAYSLAFGVLLLVLAFRLRSLARQASRRPELMTVP